VDNKTVPNRLQGRWRACAVKVHVLIRGDLQCVPASRACPKGGTTRGNSGVVLAEVSISRSTELPSPMETGRAYTSSRSWSKIGSVICVLSNTSTVSLSTSTKKSDPMHERPPSIGGDEESKLTSSNQRTPLRCMVLFVGYICGIPRSRQILRAKKSLISR